MLVVSPRAPHNARGKNTIVSAATIVVKGANPPSSRGARPVAALRRFLRGPCDLAQPRRDGVFARGVILVEGPRDQYALEELAYRRGGNLDGDGISVVPIGGAPRPSARI
jgi:hypothetical protein